MPRVSKKTAVETPAQRERALTPAFIAGLMGAGVLVLIGAVMIGRSDSGAINVPDTINQANIEHAENGGGEQVNIGNPALQNLPNGGLVPQGTPVEQPPTVEETPATTTDATASTTQEVSATETASEESIENSAEETQTP